MSTQDKRKPGFVTLQLGPLPVALINDALDLELEEGDVVFTPAAQKHAMRNHPADFVRCLPFTGTVIANPLYAGDDFRNDGKIELISRIPSMGGALLVAISIEKEANGTYRVSSLYPVSDQKISNRLDKRYLRRL